MVRSCLEINVFQTETNLSNIFRVMPVAHRFLCNFWMYCRFLAISKVCHKHCRSQTNILGHYFALFGFVCVLVGEHTV